MSRNYWLVLYTPETWEEANAIELAFAGFRENRQKRAQQIQTGDFLLCYLTGKSRFVGILEAVGEAFWDEKPVWQSATFPVRVETRKVVTVQDDRGVHLHEVIEHSDHARSWMGYIRGSPQRLPEADGRFIADRLQEISSTAAGLPPQRASAVEAGGEDMEGEVTSPDDVRPHSRIQYRLLRLGQDMGYDVWVARNDRGRQVDGHSLGDLSVKSLPVRFDETTQTTIELIDTLWLSRNRIEAAFEIEASTAIYSGLLRMADLVAMQPMIDIPLYIVAPEERRRAVLREIRRPVFASLRPPLAEICRYLSFERLEQELDRLGSHTRHMRASFLREISESA